MATRRSTRLSGELDAAGGKAVNGKRKNAVGDREGEDGEADKKKKKIGGKAKFAFQPQPVPLPNSSNTPPEDDLPLPPPPPSERKIARRRDSARALHERPTSPSPPPAAMLYQGNAKRQKVGGESSRGKSTEPSSRGVLRPADDPLQGLDEAAAMRNREGPTPHVEGLTFSRAARPRPSIARPSSPPRRTFGAPSKAGSSKAPAPLSTGAMPPPSTFVRKTRKSLGIGRSQRDQVVPVMESETPVIRKNQELRGQQARRSSLDHRGGRASSSWGRGEITMPHKSVEYSSFYRHIPSAMPEPIKARMLLVWCGKRALDRALRPPSSSLSRDKGKGKATELRTDEGDQILKDVMEEFVQRMNRGAVDTSVFSVPGQEASTVSGLKPHPRNVDNRKTEADAMAAIRKYKEEGVQWSTIVNAANNKQHDTIRRLEKKMMTNADPDMSSAPSWMRQALSLADTVLASGEDTPEAPSDFPQVEYMVDTLHQLSHRGLQFSLQATRVIDGIFSSLTADLRARDRLGLAPELPQHDTDGPDTTSLLVATRGPATSQPGHNSGAAAAGNKGKGKDDAMSLLRVLAAAESKGQSEDTVAAAAKVAPMPAMSSMTPRRPTAGMTPRRQGLATGATPRGYGKTPRVE